MQVRNNGFTLIEVLIALAILSIALTAVIKASSQSVKNTIYLQNKTIASWVGSYVMNEARLGIIKLPAPPTKLTNQIEMLGLPCSYSVSTKPTHNAHIHEIIVEVLEQHSQQQLHFTSYLYAP